MTQTQENDKKPDFGPDLAVNFFFSKTWLYQSLDIMVRYRHVQYQKKLLVTDGQTDRRRRVGFIGRCPTNVERPTSFLVDKSLNFE